MVFEQLTRKCLLCTYDLCSILCKSQNFAMKRDIWLITHRDAHAQCHQRMLQQQVNFIR